MEGVIKVNSDYGKGSEFTVIIPQKVIDNTPIGVIDFSSINVTPVNHKHESQFVAPEARILVVDDVEVNLKVFANLVKQLNNLMLCMYLSKLSYG